MKMVGKIFTLNEVVLEELQLADDSSRKPMESYITPPDENDGWCSNR